MKNNEIKEIHINIWDDYFDDGYIPEGEIQKTYIYVEGIFPIEKEKEYLEYLMNHIKSYNYSNIKLYMYFYDSKILYPNLNESSHFSRWEIKIENMTHIQRREILKKLRKENLSLKNIKYNIYSES